MAGQLWELGVQWGHTVVTQARLDPYNTYRGTFQKHDWVFSSKQSKHCKGEMKTTEEHLDKYLSIEEYHDFAVW